MKTEAEANRELEKMARLRELVREHDRLKVMRDGLIRRGKEHRHISDRLHELGWEIRSYYD